MVKKRRLEPQLEPRSRSAVSAGECPRGTWSCGPLTFDPESWVASRLFKRDGLADEIIWVRFHFRVVFLFQKRACTEAEVRSPECPMDTSQHPLTGSGQQDQHQVMELTQTHDITALFEGRTSLDMWRSLTGTTLATSSTQQVPCNRTTLLVAMVTC